MWQVLLAAPASNRRSSVAEIFILETGAEQFTKRWAIAPGESVRFTEDRVFEQNAIVVTELFLKNHREDGVFVREVSLVKSKPGDANR